jgi:hypothetical protein
MNFTTALMKISAHELAPCSPPEYPHQTSGRLVKHVRYYWLLLAESDLTRRLFESMLERIAGCRFRPIAEAVAAEKSIQSLSLAKTSSATKNSAILGSEGLNTISISSTEHGDFGSRDSCARAAHIYIRTGGRLVRTRPLDRNDDATRRVAHEH